MNIEKKSTLFIISIFWLFFGLSCSKKKAIALPNLPASVLIKQNFTSQSINEGVLVSTKFSEKDLSRKDLKKWFSENKEKIIQTKKAVLLGNFRKYPQAWIYTQIINPSNAKKQLVVDEYNRIRCDVFEVFTVENGKNIKWGRIDRTTPFSKYPFPFFTNALPITIQAKDTLNLLIHTERHYGAHEVNLNISSYETYLSEHIILFLSKVFQVIIFVICAILMLFLGQVFQFKTMTYLGVYILSLLFMHLASWGFLDAMSNFSSIGLSGRNIGTFGAFLSCFLAYPFVMEWMKVVPKNERLFNGFSYLMMGLSLFCTLCYLLPIHLFNTIYKHLDLPLLMVIIASVTVIWVLFCSVLALIKARIYYMLLGYCIAFLPLSVQQLSNYLGNSPYILFQADHSTFIFAAIGFSVISIYLLREQLVTRKKLEENLGELKETLEDIRKTEVEAIGRNLHDNVGNILASAVGYLNLKSPKTETSENLIKEAIQEIRFLSHNLVKDEDAPLLTKLESLVSRFNDFSEILFVFENFSEDRINQLDKMTQQNIYMILQEVLTNIIKHSKAKEAFIQVFEREDKTLQFTIEDDGIGITNITEKTGIGLKNIYKRANASNLKVTIDSTSDGTIFIIETPKN